MFLPVGDLGLSRRRTDLGAPADSRVLDPWQVDPFPS
jgi:hypothetical protein